MSSAEVNWSLCCLCQTNASGEMRCPAQSKQKDKGAGYESISNALSQFKDSHSLPIDVPAFIANDVNLEETLMENSAKFHKACLNKLTRLNRKGK